MFSQPTDQPTRVVVLLDCLVYRVAGAAETGEGLEDEEGEEEREERDGQAGHRQL